MPDLSGMRKELAFNFRLAVPCSRSLASIRGRKAWPFAFPYGLLPVAFLGFAFPITRLPDHARSRRFLPLSPVPCNLFPFLFLIGNSYRNDLISLFTRFIIFSINLLNRLYTFSSVLLWRRRPFHRSSERRLQMIRKSVVVLSICLLLSLASLPTLAQSIPTWQPNTAYAVGALVMFNGVEYKCIQAHTSQVGWEPPNVPALWQPVTGGGGTGCSA